MRYFFALSLVLLAIDAHSQLNAGDNVTTGKIGIGAVTPLTYDLEISRSTSPFIRLRNSTYTINPSTITSKGGIIFNQESADKTAAIQFAVPPGYHVPGILFSTKTAWNTPGPGTTDWFNRLFIHPNGFVGIGTVSPGNKLTVESEELATGKPYTSVLIRHPNVSFDGKSGAALEFSSSIGLAKIAGVDERTSSGGEFRGALTFYTRRHTGGSDAGYYERMRIDNNGNVGIGTIPTEPLHIKSTAVNQGLVIESQGKISKIQLHISEGDYGLLSLGGNTTIRGKGQVSSIEGALGIGTTNTYDYKLAVAGKMVAEEVVVKLKGSWPDYVFASDYNLLSLREVENYIKENKHLPEVPSEQEVKANGLSVGEMNAILLKKVEELTLYVIELNKKVEQQQKQLEDRQDDSQDIK